MADIEKRFNNIQEIEPDKKRLRSIKRIEKTDDTERGITLEQMDSLRRENEHSGKISLRVPKLFTKSLHKEQRMKE